MIVNMMLILSFLCLLCDAYIGWRYIRKPRRKGWPRALFFVQMIVLDICLPVAIFFVGRVYIVSDEKTQWMMWLMWWMILAFLPKLVFTVFLVLNDLLNKIVRRKWHFFEIVGGSIAGLIILLMCYGALRGVSRVRVTRIEIASAKIPKSFDGYLIAQFSDLHIGNIPKNGSLIPTLVDTLNSLRVDLIVSTGDLVNLRSSEITPPVFRLLAQMQAADGVVSVLGNHDLGTYIGGGPDVGAQSLADLKATQKELGWKLLSNEHIWIRRGADSIAVAGVEYPRNGLHGAPASTGVASDLGRAMRGVDPSVFSVLVAHTPSIWDSIPAVAAPDLTMSGHVHAMQLKFTCGDFKFSPAQWVYPEWSGLYEKGGRKLYVNDGIGYVLFPMRFGTPAEITLYELRSLAE